MDGGRVTKNVWRNPTTAKRIVLLEQTLRMATDDFVDPVTGKSWSVVRGEHRMLRRDDSSALLEELFEQVCGLFPERTNAPLVAFAVKVYTGLGFQLKVADT